MPPRLQKVLESVPGTGQYRAGLAAIPGIRIRQSFGWGRALDIDSEDRSALATLALVWIQQYDPCDALFSCMQREVGMRILTTFSLCARRLPRLAGRKVILTVARNISATRRHSDRGWRAACQRWPCVGIGRYA